MNPPSFPHVVAVSSNGPARWFAEEVHPHDSQLKAYLRHAFPSLHDVDDVVQESYVRIWKARAARPIACARAFLFTVARRVALDVVRRNRRSPVDSAVDLAALRVIDERPGVAESVSTAEKLRLLADACATLPPRSRQLILMCKIDGQTHREAAAQLGISDKTVDELVWRGLRRLVERSRCAAVVDS